LIRKALIVEDDPVSLHILKTMLEKWEFVVITATDGGEALAKFQVDRDVEMVVSDWMMPNMDGVELCKKVRAIPGRPYTYFILLTAKSQTVDVVEGMEAGADDFISKPFNQYELRVRIRAGERVLELQSQLEKKLEELSDATEQMRWDLEAAAAIQMSMLPSRQKTFPAIDYAWRFIPCDRIGGDFFNLVKLDDHRIGIYIFDVSGHGVPAALQAVALGRMLSAYDSSASILLKPGSTSNDHLILSPREVMSTLNSRFQFSGTRGDFITFLYGILDTKDLTFIYTRAGHPSPIVVSKGELIPVLDDGGIPIGIIPEPVYREHSVQLSPGDRVFFFTDGLTELANPKGARFGEERLKKYLKKTAKNRLERTVEDLTQMISNWQGEEPRMDDLTILGIELETPDTNRMKGQSAGEN
jgi:sigma-B regulation protein RsbU (phosphoserine phosphatase)